MILHVSRIALVILIGLAIFAPANKANVDNDDCSSKMSEETHRYIVETKIPLKGADWDFYTSGAEQVYLLNSEERLKLDVRQTVRSTVAVINHKVANGKGSFYVIEQEIMPGQVLFSLKNNGKLLQTLAVQLKLNSSLRSKQVGPGVPCQASSCNVINAEAAIIDAEMATIANQTCKRQTYCVQHCQCIAGAISVSQNIKYIDPTSRRCWRVNTQTKSLSAQLWMAVTESPLLDHAFDVAIKKQIRRYTI